MSDGQSLGEGRQFLHVQYWSEMHPCLYFKYRFGKSMSCILRGSDESLFRKEPSFVDGKLYFTGDKPILRRDKGSKISPSDARL